MTNSRVLLVLLFSVACSSCFLANRILDSNQRPLIKELMSKLDAGRHELEKLVENRRWDGVVRVSEEMVEVSRHLQRVKPKMDAEEFRLRAADLESDFALIAGEAKIDDGKKTRLHMKNLNFTCRSCHKKFKLGRPW